MKHGMKQLAMVAATMLLFTAALVLNEGIFRWLEWTPGIHLVYLPAGMRLLCTLLFAEAGAVGLLLVSWLACYLWFFPDDYLRAFAGGVIAAIAPYAAYRLGQRMYGIGASLQQLTPLRLLVLGALYALANALLHHLWFALQGNAGVGPGFLAMVIGDLSGTLIVLYAFKALLCVVPPATRPRDGPGYRSRR